MMDELVLQNQVKMSTSSSLGQTVWVYRGSMWAYPWYTSVRKTLEDPAYSDWYVKFKPEGPWYSNKCDEVNTTDCSDLYHNQEQSPGYVRSHSYSPSAPPLQTSPSTRCFVPHTPNGPAPSRVRPLAPFARLAPSLTPLNQPSRSTR